MHQVSAIGQINASSGLPGSKSADGGNVALAQGDTSKAVTFNASFTAAPAPDADIMLPNGSSAGVDCWADYSTLTALSVTFRFGAAIPAAGYYLSWRAVGS